ncbi:MAG: hypothetical protein OHK0011_11320 [Turneriella sp.]
MKQIAKISAFLLVTALPAAAEFDVESLPGELARRTREFLSTETAAARSGMAKFSDDELQKITTAFKKSHSKEEQRLFWLSEELYRRNAERVSAERIRYLYFAVLAALALITAFSILTFRQSNRQRRAHTPMNDFPAAVPISQAVLSKSQPKRKAAKKKTRGK